MAQQQEVRQVFFSNLLALGMDPVGLERRWRIPFNRDMFALPNKKGFEVVMYFLFDRLNPVMCQEQFKSCWPITDKKDEQNFRKVCRDWLQTITTEDANANLPLPRIVASLFMSPGGEKIYQLLFYFSSYILQHCIESGNGMRSHDFLRRPVLDKQNKMMAPAMASGLKAAAARTRKQFVDHSQQAVTVQHEWKVYGSELVKSYRTLCRDIRDLEQQVKEEVNLAAEKCAARGSPRSGRRKSGVPQYDFDVQSVHRANRVRKVRELWKSVEDFTKGYQKDREVVDSILEGTQDAYGIDAKDLNIRIPDLLLRECEQEIQRRSVDNIYQGGKLNLLSLIHLWNLSLHLYIEKLHQTGLPDLDEIRPKVTTQVHTHQAHLTNAQRLRSRLKNQTIPELKKEIRIMRDRLDSQVYRAKSPDSIRMTSLGLGFMPPTPPVNFSGEGVDPKLVPGHEPIRMNKEHVSTPEAAHVLMDNINQRVKAQQMSKLVQGTPVFAARLGTQGQPMGRNTIPTSKLPVRENIDVERVGNKQRTRHHPVSPMGPASSSEIVSATASGTTLHQTSLEVSEGARQAIRDQVSRSAGHKEEKFKAPSGTAKLTKRKTKGSSDIKPKVERHGGKKSPKALDILADQVADAVISGTPVSYRHVIGGSDLDLGAQAFISQDKLMRTPPNQSPRSQDSLGPLSSTRIEQGASDVERGATDRVVTKLFSDDGSDEDDGSIMTIGSEQEPRPPPSSQRRHHPSGCEDDGSTPQKPATSSPQLSPAMDRVRDMSPKLPKPASYMTSPRSSLPKGRSLALTSDAVVMTGDLLGMTEEDHFSAAKKPEQRLEWGSVLDSGSESNTEYVSGASRVAELPESTDTDSISSYYGLPRARPVRKTSYLAQNMNNSSRNVIGAEVDQGVESQKVQGKYNLLDEPVENNQKVQDKFSLLDDPMGDVGPFTTDLIPGLSMPFTAETLSPAPKAKPLQDSNQYNNSQENANVDDIEELLNASAQVVELQNVSHSEHMETTPKRATAAAFEEDSPPLGGGFSRNTEARGSFRDVEANVLQSFLSSTLSPLAQNLGRKKTNERIAASHSPIRSRSPCPGVDAAIKAPASLSAADIITRYRLLKEKQQGGSSLSSSNINNNASPSSTGSNSRQSSPGGSRPHTPEPGNIAPFLSERYLQKTPTKQEEAMSKRFSLNQDGDDENANVSPLRSKPSGGRLLQFGTLTMSPLASPAPETDSLLSHLELTATGTTPSSRYLKTPGVSSPPNTTLMPMSPVTDALHNFELEPTVTGRMSLDNIFDEEGPALVPLSPVVEDQYRRNHQSPAVVKLIDL